MSSNSGSGHSSQGSSVRYLIHNAEIITGTESFTGSVGIDGGLIAGVWRNDAIPDDFRAEDFADKIEAKGLCLMAGGIDAHVHFREPGMTHKGDIASESRAALLGGITSFIDMPNTYPPTVSETALEGKLALAEGRSWADYGFHLGVTNGNFEELLRVPSCKFAGIKVFMGSSTGNMLVDKEKTLEKIFQIKNKVILVHSEDQGIIDALLAKAKATYGDAIPYSAHPQIRSRLACIKSTIKALEMAVKYGTRLHICHVSTAEEVQMIRAAKIHNPLISAETSANYLWFCDEDYPRLGARIKCNPAIKSARDREALIAGLAEGIIDSIGSDHAPHTAEEKGLRGSCVKAASAVDCSVAEGKPTGAGVSYLDCPSGTVSVGQQLSLLFTIAAQTGMPLTRIASAISEKPAEIFGILGKGFIKEGMEADLVLIDPYEQFIQGKPEYKCGWSPYEGESLCGAVKAVFLHGELVAQNGRTIGSPSGRPLHYVVSKEEEGA